MVGTSISEFPKGKVYTLSFPSNNRVLAMSESVTERGYPKKEGDKEVP